MKQKIKLTLIGLTFFIHNIYGQATTPGNAWNLTPNEYLGWDNMSTTPLIIQHQTPNQTIRFLNFDKNVGAGVVALKMELTVGGAMIDDVGLPLPNNGLRLWNPGYVFKNFAS
jgi:hypothetical protein